MTAPELEPAPVPLAVAGEGDAEARAELWRDQQRNRTAYQAAMWGRLAGDPAARAALEHAWRPVLDWLAERAEPGNDPADDYGQPPPPLDEQTNL